MFHCIGDSDLLHWPLGPTIRTAPFDFLTHANMVLLAPSATPVQIVIAENRATLRRNRLIEDKTVEYEATGVSACRRITSNSYQTAARPTNGGQASPHHILTSSCSASGKRTRTRVCRVASGQPCARVWLVSDAARRSVFHFDGWLADQRLPFVVGLAGVALAGPHLNMSSNRYRMRWSCCIGLPD